jgi:hypothetical protein
MANGFASRKIVGTTARFFATPSRSNIIRVSHIVTLAETNSGTCSALHQRQFS